MRRVRVRPATTAAAPAHPLALDAISGSDPSAVRRPGARSGDVRSGLLAGRARIFGVGDLALWLLLAPVRQLARCAGLLLLAGWSVLRGRHGELGTTPYVRFATAHAARVAAPRLAPSALAALRRVRQEHTLEDERPKPAADGGIARGAEYVTRSEAAPAAHRGLAPARPPGCKTAFAGLRGCRSAELRRRDAKCELESERSLAAPDCAISARRKPMPCRRRPVRGPMGQSSLFKDYGYLDD